MLNPGSELETVDAQFRKSPLRTRRAERALQPRRIVHEPCMLGLGTGLLQPLRENLRPARRITMSMRKARSL